MTINVPERNRAIKKLLTATFPGINISVKAGNGTAYHWVDIEFMRVPEELRNLNYGQCYAVIEALIRGAGIQLSSYPADDMGGDKMNACIEVKMPRVES